MNYRHLFHAGNFADVFKHAALTLLLRAFQNKDTPFCYLDTHAGRGRYDLGAPDAQRSGEYHDGIERLWGTKPAPVELAQYLDSVHKLNDNGNLRYYPGSPLIARQLLRPQDRIVLCEKHPEEFAALKQEFSGDRQVAVHERDGYEAMKALLPPQERRGLVLIDPPYEERDELDAIVKALRVAFQRWSTGVYAVWYPIKDRAAVARFHAKLRAGDWRKVWAAELMLFREDTSFRLNGCGLAIINTPWGFDRAFDDALAVLQRLLSRDGTSRVSADWIVPE